MLRPNPDATRVISNFHSECSVKPRVLSEGNLFNNDKRLNLTALKRLKQ
jgi:hypothetical protein